MQLGAVLKISQIKPAPPHMNSLEDWKRKSEDKIYVA